MRTTSEREILIGQIVIGDEGREEVVCVTSEGKGKAQRWTAQTVPLEGRRRIGYARVSTDDQTHRLQLEALEKLELDAVFVETGSGAKERPELDRALSCLREGDELWCWRYDRLGRRALELIALIHEQGQRGVAIRSVTEPHVDPATPLGVAMLALIAVFAQMERETMIERTKAGIAASDKRNGRPPALTGEQRRTIYELRNSKSRAELARMFGCSRRTISRAITRERRSRDEV